MIRLSELTKDYYSTGEVSRMLNLNPKTAYFWCCRGTVKFFRLPGGDYAIPKAEVMRLIRERGLAADEKQRKDIIYICISSKDQPEDIERAIAQVLIPALPYKLFEPEVVQEVRSSSKTRRKELMKLAKMAANHEIGRIFIASKAQLSEFGFAYLKDYFDQCSTQIIVVNEPTQADRIRSFENMATAILERLDGLSSSQKELLSQQIDAFRTRQDKTLSLKKR